MGDTLKWVLFGAFLFLSIHIFGAMAGTGTLDAGAPFSLASWSGLKTMFAFDYDIFDSIQYVKWALSVIQGIYVFFAIREGLKTIASFIP